VTRHPGTMFIGAHVGCAPEDLDRVERMLAACPNWHVDIAARLAELGRQPRRARELILRFPDRVLFGTDAPPEPAVYPIHYRFLETLDEAFAYDAQGRPTTTTDAEGRFVYPIVRPDLYALKITMQGFKTLERTNVQVSANDKFSAGILTMEVGALTEEVSVSGRVSDPRVGRDVMIGLAFGLGLQLLIRLSIPLHDLLGIPGPPPLLGRVELLAGPVYAFGGLASVVANATVNAFVIVFLIVGLKVGLKRMPLVVGGALAFYVAITVPEMMSEGTPWIGASLGVLAMITLVTVPVRYGLLATAAAFLASFIASGVPWSLSFGTWQAQPSEIALVVLTALVVWAGWTAAGGREGDAGQRPRA